LFIEGKILLRKRQPAEGKQENSVDIFDSAFPWQYHIYLFAPCTGAPAIKKV
jgi:hypothetical protein